LVRLLRAAGVGQLRSLVGVSRLVTEQRWRVNVDGSRRVDIGVVSDSSTRCTVVSVCTFIMPTQFQFHCPPEADTK